jgi:hypothetical protein
VAGGQDEQVVDEGAATGFKVFGVTLKNWTHMYCIVYEFMIFI